MKLISSFVRSPFYFHSLERALNYSLVGYLPVNKRKNIASGRGSTPLGAFCAFSQNSGIE